MVGVWRTETASGRFGSSVMKLDSTYFDRIRIKPEEERASRDRLPNCEWPGCGELGRYPAPKGRGREGEYHRFCLAHVRVYNKTYNYFAGMSDADLMSWQRQAATGHRPTWPLGQNAGAGHNGRLRNGHGDDQGAGFRDPFQLFGDGEEQAGSRRLRRPLRQSELKALHSLGLDETASPDQVKSQYKRLVKRLHPDANGGSRANEDKLREIIQAYDHLRGAGYC